MKQFFIFLFAFIGNQLLYSQPHQIALVKPDGTTTIHSTFQSAHDAATDGDYVYLPGGGDLGYVQVDKKLYIFGAGFNYDSSAYTHITKIYSFNTTMGASGGSIEGIYTYSSVQGFAIGCNNYTVKKCHIQNSGVNIKETCSNNIFINNILGSAYNNNSFYSENGKTMFHPLLIGNIITGNVFNSDSIDAQNNIFFKENVHLSGNNTFENNIFKNGCWASYSIFNNNVNITIQNEQNYNVYNNNFDEAWPDIFIDPGISPYDYNDHNDYHIKATSQCKNSGTDGTDRGVYGGSFPWVEGSVPSNPHIYYKSVGAGTNANGQLQIHFKVRTND